MNAKVISIVGAILVVLLGVMLLMQKGNYISQAKEHYEDTTAKSYKNSKSILEFVNNTVEQNKLLWTLTCEALTSVKTAKQMADLESKYFPNVKGSTSLAEKTRTFSPNSAFPIVSYFDKVETDKKTGVKTLVGLTSISVESLLGNTPAPANAEGEELLEEDEE